MRAALYESYCTKQNFTHAHVKVVDVPKPTIKPNEVLVRNAAASVNPIDYKIMFGFLAAMIKESPRTPGFDFSGVIAEVGSECKRFKVGDSVFGMHGFNNFASFAEYVQIAENNVVLKPTNLTYLEAATVPLVGLTSYQSLNDHGKLVKGDKVLILGGSGGAGAIAIQIAKNLIGAHVTTTGSEKNFEYLKSLGADKVLDYNKDKWWEGDQTDYEVVYDCVGEKETYARAAEVFAKNKKHGRFVTIAGDRQVPEKPAGEFAPEYKRVVNDTQRTDQLEIIGKAIESGQIKPTLEKVFSFEQVGALFDSAIEGRTRGKTALQITSWANQKSESGN